MGCEGQKSQRSESLGKYKFSSRTGYTRAIGVKRLARWRRALPTAASVLRLMGGQLPMHGAVHMGLTYELSLYHRLKISETALFSFAPISTMRMMSTAEKHNVTIGSTLPNQPMRPPLNDPEPSIRDNKLS